MTLKLLLCQRVGNVPEDLKTPGCEVRECYRCDAKVDVAPSGQRMLDTQPDRRAVCDVCVAIIQGANRTTIEDYTPEQERERAAQRKRVDDGEHRRSS